ncbi:hypothetical protein NC797_02550 [Aquibacillus sp. 3ASR75-11]|uniref:Uncharacterized protein n=1 Tax=Terrihalobacillus insolitus TaxID=2950438 RepID=A0A9X4AKR4_9BACI|nr:hypothetical protein [Terrihalobacillus insolitus]MDC3411927.1 hypothetical protein [Terrihalobacillus insolitus]MDC3423386.1 hypothetical protein [Terrihalobacillus insolitus]
MVETLIDFMLGPFRSISQFYFEYQLIFNSIVIGVGLVKMFSKKKESTN